MSGEPLKSNIDRVTPERTAQSFLHFFELSAWQACQRSAQGPFPMLLMPILVPGTLVGFANNS